MPNINTFVQNLKGGGARANQFQVQLTATPPGVSLGEEFTFLCRSAQIPAMTVGEVAIPYRGRQVFVAGDRTFDAWTTTVFSDAAWEIRGALEQWSNTMQNMGEYSYGALDPSAYYGQAKVTQMNRNDTVINTYTLYQMWPQTIDPIDLAYDTNDAVMEFGVTWRYNYMHSEAGGGSVGGVRLTASFSSDF
tara:strand:+ start:396 stop:968 length:573 start_codon:yes stop_codon:yes gene_type:complete